MVPTSLDYWEVKGNSWHSGQEEATTVRSKVSSHKTLHGFTKV